MVRTVRNIIVSPEPILNMKTVKIVTARRSKRVTDRDNLFRLVYGWALPSPDRPDAFPYYMIVGSGPHMRTIYYCNIADRPPWARELVERHRILDAALAKLGARFK